MPSNRNPENGSGNTAHEKVLDAIAQAKAGDQPPKKPKPRSSFAAFRKDAVRRIDRIAANENRRLAASLLLAFAINAAVLTALAVFGRVRIWVPNAPADSINIVFVEDTPQPIFPELRDPEIVPEPEPEPEPEEPEIIEEPELVEEPEPEPTPEPEEAPTPPEPEPEPVLDLTPEPEFAPPAEEPAPPLIPEAAPEQAPGPLDVEPADPGDIAVEDAVEEEQSPTDEEEPLVEDEPEDVGFEVTEDASDDEGEMTVGDERPLEIEAPEEIGDEEEPVFNDDFFDNQDRFIQPRQALPLPTVDLPEGESAAVPGDSGVVAIFCPEQFENEDKQKECAGRTQILSGWRPGASGENWDEAIRLLKQERREGIRAGTPESVFGPAEARRIEDEIRARELRDFRRSADDVNNLPQTNDNLGDALGRPDIGPDEFQPSWTRRDDPTFDQDDIDRLERELDEAAEANEPN